MKKITILFLPFFVFLSVVFSPYAFCQKGDYLKEGISQYQQENYQKAIEILKKARDEDPKSSTAAFFLGMAYKQLMNYPNASENLNDAVTLTPRIKEAIVELIDVLQLMGKLEEAKKWIEVAKKEEIFPAKVAFLEGLVLQKEGKNLEAVKSFEKAKSLDKKMTQAAELQIALCYVKEKKIKKAKDRFQAAIQYDPQTDLASFARQYIDLVEKRIALERPIRVTLGLFGQYDTNLLLKPSEEAFATGITDEKTYTTAASAKIDYVPVFHGPWLFNAQYAFFGNFHDKHSTTHDSISNGIYVAPGYNFGKCALNLAARYNHVLVRDPSHKEYMDSLGVGPLFRMLLGKNSIGEVYAGWATNEYFKEPLIPEEDRDSDVMNAYISWIWFFKEGAFFNLKYGYSVEDTEGENWENQAHAFSLNTAIPLIDNIVKLQISGQMIFQEYQNIHTIFGIEREDEIYQGSVGLTWEFFKNANLVVQYSHTTDDSNIGLYSYERDLYTAGVEYRF